MDIPRRSTYPYLLAGSRRKLCIHGNSSDDVETAELLVQLELEESFLIDEVTDIESGLLIHLDTRGGIVVSWLLGFYVLAISKVISEQVPTCDSLHSWRLTSAAPLGDQATSTMISHPVTLSYH